jgi:hypothetical protein
MVFSLALFLSCVKEDDFAIPSLKNPFYAEEFQDVNEVQHNTVLNIPGWTNFAESGTVLWYERIYQGDGYAQFNPYGSSDNSSITWLISPSVDVSSSPNPKFSFQSAQNFVSSDANTVLVYVSTDYDGTNVLVATWNQVEVKVANKNTEGYLFVSSGEIDLNPYKAQGQIYIAFKVIGSGTNQNLDGLFQINNVYVYTSK